MDAVNLRDERLCWDAPEGLVELSGAFAPSRFPQDVLDAARRDSPGAVSRMECPSCCRLLLTTDASRLALSIRVLDAPRDFGEFVAREDGRTIGVYRNMAFRPGDLRFEIPLEGGGRMRALDLLLPHNLAFVIASIETNGSLAAPPPLPRPVWLALGDSITQGMNALSPSSLFVRRIADACSVGAWNLGIGGARMDVRPFRWAFARRRWRVVTIGLGSNDWLFEAPLDELRDRTRQMIDAAREGAPRARIIFITPPAERREKRPAGPPIEAYRDAVREIAEAAGDGVFAVDGRMLADHDLGHFTPDGVHLSDAGFVAYGERLMAVATFADALVPPGA